jgi:PTH1 family peptidyl-tRNA hydrolase
LKKHQVLDKDFRSEGKIYSLENGWQVVFLNCYMNKSGLNLKGLMKVNKDWQVENLVFVHDDLDVPLGEFKIQQDRGSAGHRGVESVINALVTSDFKRIRIGIGRSEDIPEEKYVLMKFNKQERKQLAEIFEKILVKLD